MNNQLNRVISYINEYLMDLGYIDKIDNNIRNKIDSDQIFNICILSATSLIKYDHSLKGFESEYNELLETRFIDTLSKNLLLYLSSIIIQGNIQATHIITHIIDNNIKMRYNNDPLSNLTYQICEIFEVCVIKNIRNVYCKSINNTLTLLELPEKKLLSSYVIPTHMPEIIEPDTTYDSISDYLYNSKSLSYGLSKVEMSQETRDSLIISQKKKFRINPNAIMLFEILDELPYDDIKHLDSLPFTPMQHLLYLENKINNMSHNISHNISNSIKYEFYNIRKNKNTKIDNVQEYLSDKIGVEIDIIKYHMEYYTHIKDLKERTRLRKLHNTTIKFAELFIDFPIYFSNTYDYRLRMYPYTYFFSRTTGIYKYLVTEYEQTKLTPEGYINMVKAYVNNFPSKYVHLGD
jgi:hypothetical protein